MASEEVIVTIDEFERRFLRPMVALMYLNTGEEKFLDFLREVGPTTDGENNVQ